MVQGQLRKKDDDASPLVVIPPEEIPSCCNSCCGQNCWLEPPNSGTARSYNNECVSMEFCRYSSIHGLKYIGQTRGHLAERILWAIFFIAALVASVYLCKDLLTKYINSPVTVTFTEEAIHIDDIPFPAITICNVNNVQSWKVAQLAQTAYYGKQLGLSEAQIQKAVDELSLLQHVCDSTSTSFSSKFSNMTFSDSLQEWRDQMLQGKGGVPRPGMDVTTFLQERAQPCSEMILLCMWQNKAIADCQELFHEVITDYGKCCTFNMAPERLLAVYPRTNRKNSLEEKWRQRKFDTDSLILNDKETQQIRSDLPPGAPPYPPEYPKRVRSSGLSNGISIVLDPDLDQYFCTAADSLGFQIAVHLPVEFPKIAEFGDAISHNTEAFLKMRPDVTKADKDIKDLPRDSRNCFFSDEFPLKYFNVYTRQNCADECYADVTNWYCNCTRFYMPREPSRKLCTHDGIACTLELDGELTQYEEDHGHEYCALCLSSCNNINYIAELTTRPIRDDENVWKHPRANVTHWRDRKVSILHVYFADDTTYPKVRKRLLGITDLLAGIGSLLGLTIGFSALSLCELLYFVLRKVSTWCLRVLRVNQWCDGEKLCCCCSDDTNSQDEDDGRSTRSSSSTSSVRSPPERRTRKPSARNQPRSLPMGVSHSRPTRVTVQPRQNIAWSFYPEELGPRNGNNNYY